MKIDQPDPETEYSANDHGDLKGVPLPFFLDIFLVSLVFDKPQEDGTYQP
jgi:hypothetical protein